jgi:hypothetical protein
MPARLPDEDLAPVEGAPPPQAAVAPSAFGLNVAGEALSQAGTVGFRAAAIKQRAQAAEDLRAVGGNLTDVSGQLNDVYQKAFATYGGEPGFGERMKVANQQVVDDYVKANGAGMTPGQRAQFDLKSQELLNNYQGKALEAQTAVQATALSEAYKAHQEARYNTFAVPFSTQLDALRLAAQRVEPTATPIRCRTTSRAPTRCTTPAGPRRRRTCRRRSRRSSSRSSISASRPSWPSSPASSATSSPSTR